MHRRPRWLRIRARIGERIDVIQILHTARQRHLAAPSVSRPCKRPIVRDIGPFFLRSKKGNHARARTAAGGPTRTGGPCINAPRASADRTTALRERTNQFVVPPIYFHSSRPATNEKTNLALNPSPFYLRGAAVPFPLVSLSSSSRSIRVYRLGDETEAHVNTLIAVNRYLPPPPPPVYVPLARSVSMRFVLCE